MSKKSSTPKRNARLAAFNEPSTPPTSPGKSKQPIPPAPPTESTYHRKVRSLLQELRAVTETWDDIVQVDGLRAARTLVDARTDLDNDLALVPAGTQPKYRVVTDKIALMEKCITDLDKVLNSLRKQFQKMCTIVEGMEGLLFDAYKTRGWQFVQEPLWVTWSLEKFASSIPDILPAYHRSLKMHEDIVNTLRSHSVSFEVSRTAIHDWVTQTHLEDTSWDAQWEDLCSVEIERWDK